VCSADDLPFDDQAFDSVSVRFGYMFLPDLAKATTEFARVLRPGGRVAVSDLALLQPLPESVRADMEALVGCVAGAVLAEDSRAQAEAAGLRGVSLRSKPEYIDAMTSWEDPLYRKIVAALPAGSRPSDYITSLDITAER